MLPFRLVYHEGYDLNLGDHVFPSQKFRWIRERMLRTNFCVEEDFVRPEPAREEDLRLAHDAAWIAKLRDGTLSHGEMMQLEIPYSKRMVEAFWLAAGGTMLAARLALTDGVSYNIGGGFHHAFAGHGEGFCAINDIAVGIRALQRDGAIRRAMVVDCDVHHGNGTAGIFAHDDSVFTLSIHQFANYPALKPPSDLDIHLTDGTGDTEYLGLLGGGYRQSLDKFNAELVIFVAGADPYFDDQLGGLSLSMEGLAARDRLVLGEAITRKIPVVVVLAGGYSMNVEDTVSIHARTAAVAAELLRARSN